MNSSQAEQPPTRRGILWRWVAAVAGAGVLLGAISVWNLFTLSRETTTLRKELFAALPLAANPQVQISAGPMLLGVARAALAFIPDVPPEARQALRAVRAASVGIYQLRGEVDSSDRVKLFAAADRVMAQRRWSRIIGVNQGHDTVLVYMPVKFEGRDRIQVCLAVCAEDKLVLVSAVGHGDELFELIQQHHRLSEI